SDLHGTASCRYGIGHCLRAACPPPGKASWRRVAAVSTKRRTGGPEEEKPPRGRNLWQGRLSANGVCHCFVGAPCCSSDRQYSWLSFLLTGKTDDRRPTVRTGAI